MPTGIFSFFVLPHKRHRTIVGQFMLYLFVALKNKPSRTEPIMYIYMVILLSAKSFNKKKERADFLIVESAQIVTFVFAIKLQ